MPPFTIREFGRGLVHERYWRDRAKGAIETNRAIKHGAWVEGENGEREFLPPADSQTRATLFADRLRTGLSIGGVVGLGVLGYLDPSYHELAHHVVGLNEGAADLIREGALGTLLVQLGLRAGKSEREAKKIADRWGGPVKRTIKKQDHEQRLEKQEAKARRKAEREARKAQGVDSFAMNKATDGRDGRSS